MCRFNVIDVESDCNGIMFPSGFSLNGMVSRGKLGYGQKLQIIAAGMAGLSAGVHARRNGYDVEIFEMHQLPDLPDFFAVTPEKFASAA